MGQGRVNADPGGSQVDSDSGDLGHVCHDLLDASKRRVRRMFNDDEAPIPLSRGRFQALSSDDELEHSEELLATQVDRASPEDEPSSQCVAVAAPGVVDG